MESKIVAEKREVGAVEGGFSIKWIMKLNLWFDFIVVVNAAITSTV